MLASHGLGLSIVQQMMELQGGRCDTSRVRKAVLVFISHCQFSKNLQLNECNLQFPRTRQIANCKVISNSNPIQKIRKEFLQCVFGRFALFIKLRLFGIIFARVEQFYEKSEKVNRIFEQTARPAIYKKAGNAW